MDRYTFKANGKDFTGWEDDNFALSDVIETIETINWDDYESVTVSKNN